MSTVAAEYELRQEAIKEAAEAKAAGEQRNILDPGMDLTLRPMRYPAFFEMYRNAIKNTWTVAEVDFSDDLVDLRSMMASERHLVNRLVAFFATGDTIVSNNLVLNLYKHINAPEARMYLSRQLFEEAQHIEFYLTLLDNYIPDHDERHEAFAAIDNIPSIKQKADFYFKWMHNVHDLDVIRTKADRKKFLMNLFCFAACVEGLSFYAAFAYVYFLRSKGLLNGLADGTNWVFRDESCHMNFAFAVADTVRAEEPDLFDEAMADDIRAMVQEAVDCEVAFAEDVLGQGVPGLSIKDMREYLEYVADQRLMNIGLPKHYNTRNPLKFMELQDVEGLSNFFERTVSSYQVAVEGDVSFDEDF
jgi:ribonucleoside-diphosphate reductase beta chain